MSDSGNSEESNGSEAAIEGCSHKRLYRRSLRHVSDGRTTRPSDVLKADHTIDVPAANAVFCTMWEQTDGGWTP